MNKEELQALKKERAEKMQDRINSLKEERTKQSEGENAMEQNENNENIVIQQGPCPPCDNTIDFCVDIIIPAPFEFASLDLLDFQALDVSCLQCCLEPCDANATITNPCGGEELVCPVEINAVRALGCVNVYLDVFGFNSNNSQLGIFCGNTTVCVDNVICYRCVTDPDPCVNGFFNDASITDVAVADVITTSCGNTLVSVTGTINLPTC